MTTRILLAVCASFLYLTSFAQEVPQEQRSLITKYTATWCPNCGNWGWTFMESLLEDNANEALIIGAHFSGTLQAPESIAMGQNVSIAGQPVFVLNDTNVGATSSNHTSKRAEIRNQVEANFQDSPLVNTGIEMSMSPDNELIINTKTRFFQAATGDYYMGVYILEDDVNEPQSGNVSDDIHPRVLRQSVNGNFGELIASGDVAEGMEVNGTYTLAMNSAWNMDGLRVAAIVWQKNGDKYEYVNAYDTDMFVPFVGTNEIVAADISFQLAPTIVQNKATLSFNLDNTQHAQIALFDTNGRLVNRVFEGALTPGTQQFEVNNQGFSGLYFLQLNLDGKVLTEKIIFE